MFPLDRQNERLNWNESVYNKSGLAEDMMKFGNVSGCWYLFTYKTRSGSIFSVRIYLNLHYQQDTIGDNFSVEYSWFELEVFIQYWLPYPN